MARILLEIEYDGTDTLGFQTQTARQPREGQRACKKASALPSVQGTLESKLSQFFAQPIFVEGAGRTDAGVHATGQVVAFDVAGLAGERELPKVVHGLNAILPRWLRVRRATRAPLDFRPRYRATRRRYHYQILDGQPTIYHPFWSRYCHVETTQLDLEAMQRAANRLLGVHNFRPFSKSEPLEKNTVRDLQCLEILRRHTSQSVGPLQPLSSLVVVDVAANAFLRSMVRLLVDGLLKVGRGQWEEQRLWDRLTDPDLSKNRLAAAPACGLTLVEVHLPEISWD